MTEQLESRELLAVADAYFAAAGELLRIDAAEGVLSNDSVPDDQVAEVSLVRAPAQGTFELDGDGAFRYRAAAGYTGPDSFVYEIRVGEGPAESVRVDLAVLTQPLIIHEVVAANRDSLLTRIRPNADAPFSGDPLTPDWIELRNLADRPIDLSGYALTDDADDAGKWLIPAGSQIPASGYLIVFASGEDVDDVQLDETNALHTNFRLSADGEYLALRNRDGQLIQEFAPSLPPQSTDVAYGVAGTEYRYLSPATPGVSNALAASYLGTLRDVTASESGGFFEAPMELTLSAPDEFAQIRYTLDGSEPTWENGFDYTQPIRVESTTVIRAAAFAPNYFRSRLLTRTFVFLDDVVRQSPDGAPPEGWPARVRAKRLNYGMDPAIVDSPEWGPQMRDALLQIPSISVVTDRANLFDQETGIYVNADRDGVEWERPASIELVHPDGTPGFQIDAGLRIRGGFSRSTINPKHSFRLLFRSEYGDSRLEYPLFGDEGTRSFQQIDFRTAQNQAWQFGQNKNSFMRDTFGRDTQRDMQQPYKRSRYYHLYLNGQYWGIYETDERAESDFAATYFGGTPGDYDVVKTSNINTFATAGSLDEWNELWEISNRGFVDNADYYAVQGKNPDGTDNPALERHVDIDNLIDYMLIIFYTGNTDGPTTAAGINNFYAIRNRNARDAWRFFIHDSENTLQSIAVNTTTDSPWGERVQQFNPRWLHQRLMENSEYRMRFVDRVYDHFFDDGVFTPDQVEQRLRQRIDQIDLAIIAESARWGDVTRFEYTKTDWLTDIDFLLNTVAPQRRDIVVQQLVEQGGYPELLPPAIRLEPAVNGRPPLVEVTASSGVIYATTDGSDPRAPGGLIDPAARMLGQSGTFTLEPGMVIRARVLENGIWSALAEGVDRFGALTPPDSLRISEVHYHPADPSDAEIAAGFDDADEFEFVELVNPTETTMDLSQVRLALRNMGGDEQGVAFDFSTSGLTRLGPGQRVVVVENVEAFRLRYGDDVPVAGQWTGRLSNAREQLTLMVGSRILQSFGYADDWYPSTDGVGASLELVEAFAAEASRWNHPESWRPSIPVGGTPGRPALLPGDANGDAIFDADDLILLFQLGQYEDSIVGNSTFATGDWNGDGEFTSRDFVFAFQYGLFQP